MRRTRRDEALVRAFLRECHQLRRRPGDALRTLAVALVLLSMLGGGFALLSAVLSARL